MLTYLEKTYFSMILFLYFIATYLESCSVCPSRLTLLSLMKLAVILLSSCGRFFLERITVFYLLNQKKLIRRILRNNVVTLIQVWSGVGAAHE